MQYQKIKIGSLILLGLILVSLLFNKFNLLVLVGLLSMNIISIIKGIKSPKLLIIYTLFYSMFIKGLLNLFSLPYSLNYFADVFVIVLFFKAIYDIYKKNIEFKFNYLYSILAVFMVINLIGIIINQVPILQVLWGLRNNYRFFAYIVTCIVYLDFSDYKKLLNLFVYLIPFHLILCLFQYFVLNLHPDNIGGLFGILTGVNGYMNFYLCIITSYLINMFINNKLNVKKLGVYILCILLIATLTELKFFYIEIVLIMVIAFVVSGNKKRNIKFLFVALLFTVVFINLLYFIYPDFRNFFTIDYLLEYLTRGYSSAGELNRLTAIGELSKNYITSLHNQIFGIGLGNADTSQYSFLNSEFYMNYGVALRYTWFSHAFMFIECGYLGLFVYVSMFLYISYKAFDEFKKNVDCESRIILMTSMILSALCLIQIIYNAALRNEAAYMLYLFMAIPFSKKFKEEKCLISKDVNEREKISVIVPVYNVSEFLERCVNSITNQSYRNLEIILVNDGSTDNSGLICEELAQKDSRIIVLNKPNGGLSDARNYGLKFASSKYVSFIDSDDFIYPNMIEVLYHNLKGFDADISVCDKIDVYDDEYPQNNKKDIKIELMNNVEALKKINKLGVFDVSACDKLFKKELFSDIEFPVGKKSEDFFIMYRLFDKCKNIVYINEELYCYFQREGSISRNVNINFDSIEASKSQYEYFEKNHTDLVNDGKVTYSFMNIWTYNIAISHDVELSQEIKNSLQNVVRNNYLYILTSRLINVKKKISATLFVVSLDLYKFVWKKL